ncbi:MAG: cellulase family glycosylhydrolase [Eubacteriales bacterium]|nr:cellulase family glycosylhydrolase [Eubacteriales bacterium]
MKKIIAVLLVCIIMCPMMPVFALDPESTGSVQLRVLGNKLVFDNDTSIEVQLTGVNTCGSEWMANPESERVKRNVIEAINNWDCNLIRLGVSTQGWWGRYDWVRDGGASYRNYIADVINVIRDSGKYVILDLHEYKYMSVDFGQFWDEASILFGNNPAVLFGLLNEPCGSDVTWETWRNGNGGDNIGLQAAVEIIRDNGAKNILVAGGLSYSGTLTGVASGEYALVDCGTNGDTTKSGYGIVYDAHIYPAHGQTPSWDADFGEARKKYPILIGEFGWDINDSVVMGDAGKPNNGNYHTRWFPEMYDWIEDEITYGSKANWTAWCFHPSSSPRMLELVDENGIKFHDNAYAFTPTPWFGQYIKDWLKVKRGDNLALNKGIVSYTQGRPADSTAPSLALDGDKTTGWKCAFSGTKSIVIDLGDVYPINRWQVFHNNSIYNYSLYTSVDGDNWSLADNHITYDSDCSDRYIKSTNARYVKLEITSSTQVCEISEIRIVADNKAVGYIDSDAPTSLEDVALSELIYDFYNGDTIPCWYSSAQGCSYIDNASEDSKGRVLRLIDASQRMIAMQSFSNLSNFDYFEYKYKSSYPVKVYFYLDYRISGKTLKTNTITLPSTNGEWKIRRITPEELMPTPEDTWVKTDMGTRYNSNGANFEPVLITRMDTSTTGYADFEYIKAGWLMKEFFGFQTIRVLQNDKECTTLNQGSADFYIRFKNANEKKLMEMVCVVGIYNDENKLVNVATLPFNAGAKIHTQEYKLTVDISYDNCTARIFTWRSGENMIPVTGNVEF